MKYKNALIAIIVGGAALTSVTAGADEDFKCKTRSDLVGPCWMVHGRLQVNNGTPSTRIWPVGTKRILGVEDAFFGNDEESASPPEIRKYGFDAIIYADFLVCPLTKQQPGVMQSVCVSAARKIHVNLLVDKNGKDNESWITLKDTDEY